MKINPFIFGLTVLALFLGTIFGFKQAGLWSTSGKVDGGGRSIQPSGGDVATIKGWMTLAQVSTAFNIPVEEILSAFNLPADTPAQTPIKDLESDSFSMEVLRTWLESYPTP
jgi:hypothetical protein